MLFLHIGDKVRIAIYTAIGDKVRIAIYTAIVATVIDYTAIWANVIIYTVIGAKIIFILCKINEASSFDHQNYPLEIIVFL